MYSFWYCQDNIFSWKFFQGLAQVSQSQNQEAGHFSDTTASAGGSDDEGSTAATDGSTLRTSPAEQVCFLVLNISVIF